MSEGSAEAPKIPVKPKPPLTEPAPALTPEEVKKFEKTLVGKGIVTEEGIKRARNMEEMIERGETPPEHILPESAPSVETLERYFSEHGHKDYSEGLSDLPVEERRYRMYKLAKGLLNDETLKELGISTESENPEPSSK